MTAFCMLFEEVVDNKAVVWSFVYIALYHAYCSFRCKIKTKFIFNYEHASVRFIVPSNVIEMIKLKCLRLTKRRFSFISFVPHKSVCLTSKVLNLIHSMPMKKFRMIHSKIMRFFHGPEVFRWNQSFASRTVQWFRCSLGELGMKSSNFNESGVSWKFKVFLYVHARRLNGLDRFKYRKRL